MMKSEDDPIADDEWLLRRVRKERFRTCKVPMISPGAFEPRTQGRDIDVDGISLYRAACLSNPSDVFDTLADEHRADNGIVRLSVSFVKSLGLSVRISHDNHIKGHVVIPELNAEEYRTNKERFTPIKHKLATEASKDENIMMRPASLNDSENSPQK